ncbi:hypothetical protein D3C87_1732820 [compost metagenome]
MTDIGLDRTEQNRLRLAWRQRVPGALQGIDFHRIAQACSRAVGFDVTDSGCQRRRVGGKQQTFLRIGVGRRQRVRPPAVILLGGLDHRMNAVAVAASIDQTLEQQAANPLCTNVAIGFAIERGATKVRR